MIRCSEFSGGQPRRDNPAPMEFSGSPLDVWYGQLRRAATFASEHRHDLVGPAEQHRTREIVVVSNLLHTHDLVDQLRYAAAEPTQVPPQVLAGQVELLATAD